MSLDLGKYYGPCLLFKGILRAFPLHSPSRACMVMPSRRAASISVFPFLLSLVEILENGHAVTEYEHFL